LKKKVEEAALETMKLLYDGFERNDFEEPSEFWIKSFKERNELRATASQTLESERAKMGTIGNISEWFDSTYSKIDLNEYDPRMIGNGDETMLETKNKLICLIKRSSKVAVIEDDELNEHITFLVLSTTNGDTMPPLVIFNLKNTPTNLDQLISADKIIVTGQKSGWVDIPSFNAWSKKLVDWVKVRRIALNLPENSKFLLFLDSHSSRESSETLELLKKNNIVVVSFPSHTSHILQPLDVGPFAYFKKYSRIWKLKIKRETIKFEGDEVKSIKSIDRARNILCAVNALQQAFCYTFVERGWRLSGLYPRDKSKALANPRIHPNLEVTMTNTKRKRLPSVGGIITDSKVISDLKAYEESESKKQKTQVSFF